MVGYEGGMSIRPLSSGCLSSRSSSFGNGVLVKGCSPSSEFVEGCLSMVEAIQSSFLDCVN